MNHKKELENLNIIKWTETIENIVPKCPICKKVYLNGIWYDSKYINFAQKTTYRPVLDNLNCIQEKYKLTGLQIENLIIECEIQRIEYETLQKEIPQKRKVNLGY